MVHHRRGLRRLLHDDELADRIEADWKSAGLDQRRLAMLRHSVLLTQSPHEIRQTDIEALRTSGFEDEDILAIAEVAGYYAYANRVVSGLGVELEDEGRGGDQQQQED